MIGGGYILEDKGEPRLKRPEDAREDELMRFSDEVIDNKRFPEKDKMKLKYFDYDQLKDLYYSAVNNKGEKIPDNIIDLRAEYKQI